MRRSIFSLLAAIVAVLLLIYISNYISESMNTDDGVEGFAALFGAVASGPFRIAMALGALFSGVAWLAVQRWAAMTGAILFCVSMILLPAWFIFAVVPAILGFIGFARMKR